MNARPGGESHGGTKRHQKSVAQRCSLCNLTGLLAGGKSGKAHMH